MADYVQRQFAGWMAPGDDTEACTYAPSERIWDFRDVTPSAILKLADGKWVADSRTIAISSSLTLALPADYDTAERLCVNIQTNRLLKAVVVIPVVGTSTALIRPGLSTDQNGLWVSASRVTSIVITNTSSTLTAKVSWALYELPDLEDPDSFLQGYQTIGIIPNQGTP